MSGQVLKALEILQSHGVNLIIIEYLKAPLTLEQINQLRSHFDLKDFVRDGEPVFKELNLTLADEKRILHAMVEKPLLMQRPIVVCGDNAIIARPPEKVLEFISNNGYSSQWLRIHLTGLIAPPARLTTLLVTLQDPSFSPTILVRFCKRIFKRIHYYDLMPELHSHLFDNQKRMA